MEDYLEAIARLVGEKGAARARDIAAALTVHKSTVTAALQSLAKKDLVNYVAYEAATLTPAGRKIADDVIRRHEIVRGFFMQILAVDEATADANACRMEHVLDAEVLDRLACFAEFIKSCPSANQRCLKRFQDYFQESSKGQGSAEDAATPPPTPKKPKAAKRPARARRSSPAD
jgi:DtxR family transcriptional regulator, Mn-dependent transcriptional regulator